MAFYSLYLFIPPLAPLLLFYCLCVLFWVPCGVASWLKASPGEIRVPYHTIPYHTIPYHTIPYHTIPYHTIPYHTIPYHTIPYHTIPYHTIGSFILATWNGIEYIIQKVQMHHAHHTTYTQHPHPHITHAPHSYMCTYTLSDSTVGWWWLFVFPTKMKH